MLSTTWASLMVIDTFKARVQESGKSCSDFKTEAFFTSRKKEDSSGKNPSTCLASRAPSRMVSDQMINIFFQEWAPLFPVVHRPTVLKAYSDYVNESEGLKDNHSLAQLNLIFGIAALSAEVRITHDSKLYLIFADFQLVEQAECSNV